MPAVGFQDHFAVTSRDPEYCFEICPEYIFRGQNQRLKISPRSWFDHADGHPNAYAAKLCCVVVSVGLIQCIIAAAVRCSPVQVVPDDQWVESLLSSVNTCKDGKFGKSQKSQFFLVQHKKFLFRILHRYVYDQFLHQTAGQTKCLVECFEAHFQHQISDDD